MEVLSEVKTNRNPKRTMRIHNFKWTVWFVPECPALNDELCLGFTDYLEQTIKIRTGMSEELTKATVIHELCHAFLFCYGIQADSYDEEQLCEFFATHAERIMKLADRIMEKRNGNTEQA